MDNNIVYLKHILEAIEKAEKYLNGIDYDNFIKNEMMIDAVVRQLEIIGEAVNNLSPEFHDKHPKFYWRNAIDMRNFLIHEYFGINNKIVWDTCQVDLKDLKKIVLNIL